MSDDRRDRPTFLAERDEAAFLTVIGDAPGDRVPRLIYADWLDERGDPRGELIRVHCELSEMPTADRRFWGFVEREKSLLGHCTREWFALIELGYEFRIEDVLPRANGLGSALPDAMILLAGELLRGRMWSLQGVRIPLADGSEHVHTAALLERYEGSVDSWAAADAGTVGIGLVRGRLHIRPGDVVRGGICRPSEPSHSHGYRTDAGEPTPPSDDAEAAAPRWWHLWR